MKVVATVWLPVLTSLIWSQCDSARILAFLPIPAKSHQRVIQPLLRELTVRGHHVTYVTPYPLQDPPKNYSLIEVPDLMKDLKQKMNAEGNELEWFIKLKNPAFKILGAFWKLMSMSFIELTLQNDNVRRLIDSDLQFDLVILETTFLQEPFIALGDKFKAPVIEFVPAGNLHWTYWLHGNPIETSYMEDASLPYTDHMSFTERTFNTFMSHWYRFIGYYFVTPKYQALMDEYIRYPGWQARPPILDMISQYTSLVLVNSHFSVNYPQPSSPNVIEVGGLNIAAPKALPKDLQEVLDSATDGAIYFTLGSHLDVSGILGEDQRIAFAKVFGELKQKVLWKWEKDFPNPPANVIISKWFPQQEILAHKNCKVFITHGGLLSTTEAVYQGIPTIGIPIMPDQDKNVVHMLHNGYGVMLQPYNLTYDSLKWAINEVLSNSKYKENAKKRSELFRDKPETALETAVYWTEYVIRHKGAHHLKPAIATMPWYQQAMIDVYSVIAVSIILPLYLLYKLQKFFCKLLCGFKKDNKAKINKKKKTQ